MFRSPGFFRPLDAILIVLITAAAAWGFLTFRVSEGTKAMVYIGNKKYGWYELAGPSRRISVPTRIGDFAMEIRDGSVRVVSSPCRNKICIKTGPIRHNHSEIVCMPGHLLIVVESDRADKSGSGEGTDAVTF